MVEEKKGPKMVTRGCQTNLKKPVVPVKEESKISAATTKKGKIAADSAGFS